MKTTNASEAGSYIIGAIYDGLSAKVEGADIVSSTGSFAKMKSAQKDQVAASYLHLILQEQNEYFPGYDPAKKIEAIHPRLITLLKKNWNESDFRNKDPQEAAALEKIAVASAVFHALRKAMDIKEGALTARPTNEKEARALAKEEVKVHAALETILALLPKVKPFSITDKPAESFGQVLGTVRHLTTGREDCKDDQELIALVSYWRRFRASKFEIILGPEDGGIYPTHWPDNDDMIRNAADRARKWEEEDRDLKALVLAQIMLFNAKQQEEQERANLPLVPRAPTPVPPPEPPPAPLAPTARMEDVLAQLMLGANLK